MTRSVDAKFNRSSLFLVIRGCIGVQVPQPQWEFEEKEENATTPKPNPKVSCAKPWNTFWKGLRNRELSLQNNVSLLPRIDTTRAEIKVCICNEWDGCNDQNSGTGLGKAVGWSLQIFAQALLLLPGICMQMESKLFQ